MGALALLLGSIFLFYAILASMDAKELQMLGFREEARFVARIAFALAIVGFVFLSGGTPTPEVLLPEPDPFG